ncbi:MAG: SAM-dependent methyltransferase [Bacteroidia bacterium]|jgi:SAM-dependent methyltransferase|nr:MAG: SAM-dependent methyltransferase [Bacteroidia bacterium]
MEEWFSSSFYKLLYAHRDDTEAEKFVDILLKYLQLPMGASALDAGCGEGRYARALAKAGLKVDAVDMAPVQPHLPAGVRFFQADLRTWEPDKRYDFIGSFFTTFGLGAQRWDELVRLMHRFVRWLAPEGWLVIDYLNIYRRNPITHEEREVEGIHFFIERWQTIFHLHKRITVTLPSGERKVYEEKVFKLTQGDLAQIAERSGLIVEDFWGDYTGAPFQVERSLRLILLARKPVS